MLRCFRDSVRVHRMRRRKQRVPHPASEAARTMRTTFVVLLLFSLRLAAVKLQCTERQHSSLTCFNDFNRNITCVWNSWNASTGGGGAPCGVHAKRINAPQPDREYNSSCVLRPLDVWTPSSLQTCSIIFIDIHDINDSIFQAHHVLRVWINCSDVAMNYTPACHVKLPPPGMPQINQTTISWASAEEYMKYDVQLEWKLANEPWNGALVHRETKYSDESCRSELSLDQLTRGAAYEARLRVRPSEEEDLESEWSDWSVAARWTSDVGDAAVPPADSLWLVLGLTVSGTAFAVFLALLVFRTNKTNWSSVFKRIRGPLLPDPGKSFLQNKWASPPFSSESLQSFLRPVDILAVMSVGPADPGGSGDLWYPGGHGNSWYPKALLEKITLRTTTDGFFPGMNSQQWPPPVAVASLTSGNLKPCALDSPYGAVGILVDKDGGMKDARNLLLEVLSRFSRSSGEPTPVISDYEKIEKLQSEGSDEDKDSGGKRDGEGQSPFDGIFTKGSIQVSLDYKCIQTLHHHDGPELPSTDSGIGGVGEEHGGPEEILEDGEEMAPCFPSPLGSPGCASPLGFHGPTLQSLQALVLDAADFTCGSVEPSSGGYMSVCQQDHVTD